MRTYKIRKKLQIQNSIETLQHILQHRSSISRFGDGELRMIAYYLKKGDAVYDVDTFQQYDDKLA